MSLSRAVSSTLRCTASSTPIARAWPRTSPSSTTLRASWTAQRPISSTTRRCATRDDPAVEDPEFAFLEDDAAKTAKTPSAPRSTAEEHIETASPSPPASVEEVEDDVLSEQLMEEAEFDAAFDLPPLPLVQPLPQVKSSPSTLPWYLQNRPAPEPTQAAIIPELPPNPPPLLQTLLEYVANTAGMDDLLIYDLRHLDPPAALGSSLIMILCTARSEKHLHVSADRFCRYLRREHHLRANAAGLLGRNELKIKLRRKAKRMKMLANVGGQEPEGNIDDGIRTGWICCTVGKIQAHPEDKAFVGARGQGEGFVGFNDVKPGVNVVVQMFTEEKRAEIDLENLWSGVLNTHARNEGKADEMIKALDEDVQEADLEAEVAEEEKLAEEEKKAAEEQKAKSEPASSPAPTPTSTHAFNKPRSTVGDIFPDGNNFGNRQQLRRLHTVGLRV